MGSFCLPLAALWCRFLRAYADTLWQMFSAALSYTEVLLSFLFLDIPVIAPLCASCACMPAWWIMGDVVLRALWHSWGRVPPPQPRQSIRMQTEITTCLVTVEQLEQHACRCLSAFERIVCDNVASLQQEWGFCSHCRGDKRALVQWAASVSPPEGWPQGVCLPTVGIREETEHLGHNSVSHSITSHTWQ